MEGLKTCRSCSAPIVWAKTANGKAMPLDAEPTAMGNVTLDGGVIRLSTADYNALGPRYTSHFATCPNAKGHRKP